MSLYEKLLIVAFCFSVITNIIFFYHLRKINLQNQPITAKVYDFFRWVSVAILFVVPISEAFLKKADIDIILLSDNTMEVYKQTLIYFVLPHMLYSIKDFIPEATEFLRVLKAGSTTNLDKNISSHTSSNNFKQTPNPVSDIHSETVFLQPDPNQYH